MATDVKPSAIVPNYRKFSLPDDLVVAVGILEKIVDSVREVGNADSHDGSTLLQNKMASSWLPAANSLPQLMADADSYVKPLLAEVQYANADREPYSTGHVTSSTGWEVVLKQGWGTLGVLKIAIALFERTQLDPKAFSITETPPLKVDHQDILIDLLRNTTHKPISADWNTLKARMKVEATSAAKQRTQGRGVDEERSYDQRGPDAFVFQQVGNVYEVQAFGESGTFAFDRCKGLHTIAKLLGSPGIPVPMIELIGAEAGTEKKHDPHSRQPVMDEEALRKLRETMSDLIRWRDEAKDNHDYGAADDHQRDIDELKRQILADRGLGARPRDLNSPAGKLRPRIQNPLTRAYKQLQSSGMPKTANHLQDSIGAEGEFFAYTPSEGINWNTDSNPLRPT